MPYISNTNLSSLLDKLGRDYEVYVTVKKGEQRFYSRYTEPIEGILIGEVRPFEPLKAFFTRAREKVSDGYKPDVPSSKGKPAAIVGVKACDLKGFKVQDHVFQDEDFEDPLYIKARQENLIISSDCTCAIDTCFCTALGINPYPKENFDINLSPVDRGFIVEVGSKKGQALIDKYPPLFEKDKPRHNEKRDTIREQVTADVKRNVKTNSVPKEDKLKGVIEKNYESDIWNDEAKNCVECGACNTICPTCHCFLLADQNDEKRMARFRIWDSCMIKDFARVAGGANPRPELWMRLRNRFEKKFDYFPKIANLYACTGCGRCISACPAKIDIRKVLKRLVDNA